MYCGNAEGEVLAPYVVYKADALWTTWTEGGPKGTRYNRYRFHTSTVPYRYFIKNIVIPGRILGITALGLTVVVPPIWPGSSRMSHDYVS